MAGAIPRFLSFKPLSKRLTEDARPTTETSKAARREDDRRDDRRDRHRRRRRHVSDPEHSQNEDRSLRKSSKERLSEKRKHHASRHEQATTLSSDSYFVDRRGDPKNFTYGCLHKYDIPRYVRQGSRKVLGLGRNQQIDEHSSSTSELRIVSSVRSHERRLLMSSEPSATRRSKCTLIRPSREGIARGVAEQSSDYVELADGSSRKRKRGEHTSQPSRDRHLEVSDLSDDEDTGGEHSDAAGDDEAADEKPGLFSQQPPINDTSDASAWVRLADHQAAALGVDADIRLTTTQRRTLAELKISIYEKALKNVPDQYHGMFLEKILDEGAVLWSSETRVKKWREAQQAHPTISRLWIGYLNEVQTPRTSFRYDKVKADICDLLGSLNKVRSMNGEVGFDAGLMSTHVHVLVRLLKFIHCAGYQEQAIATWQCLLILHLPGKDVSSFSLRLAEMERSWDNENPRFGDEIDKGLGCDIEKPEPVPGKHGGRWLRFANSEHTLGQVNEVPGRASDETDDPSSDDPLHVVFFSDMVDILARTSAGLDHQALIDSFLAFFNLPSLPLAAQMTCAPWRTDPFLLHADSVVKPSMLAAAGLVQNESAMWNKLDEVFPSQFTSRGSACHLVAAGLRELAFRHADFATRAYYLAFVCRYAPASAARAAKRLSKHDPADSSIYNSFAHIEWASGRSQRAIEIWKSTLASNKALQIGALDDATRWTTQCNVLRVLHDWSWSELRGGNYQQALRAIASLRSDTGVDTEALETAAISSTTRLGMERELSNVFETALTRKDAGLVQVVASIRACYQYLCKDNDLQLALEMIDRDADAVSASSTSKLGEDGTKTLQGHIHDIKADLIAVHLDQHKQYVPKQVIQSISESLQRFPSSVPLLETYGRLTSTLDHLDARIRDLRRPWLDVDERSSVANWTFAIGRELRRHGQGCREATAHAARALFQDALLGAASRVAHCPALWDAWLEFEARVLGKLSGGGGTDESGRVKIQPEDKRRGRELERQVRQVQSVFFDGVRLLPWSEDWILKGLELFDSDDHPARLQDSELRELYHLLLDRGMRIRAEMGLA